MSGIGGNFARVKNRMEEMIGRDWVAMIINWCDPFVCVRVAVFDRL